MKEARQGGEGGGSPAKQEWKPPGFVSKQGCFYVDIVKSYALIFRLAQHIREEMLIKV